MHNQDLTCPATLAEQERLAWITGDAEKAELLAKLADDAAEVKAADETLDDNYSAAASVTKTLDEIAGILDSAEGFSLYDDRVTALQSRKKAERDAALSELITDLRDKLAEAYATLSRITD